MPNAPDKLSSYRTALQGDLLSRFLAGNDGPVQADALLKALASNEVRTLEWRQISFHCPCSRERAQHALLLLGSDDIKALASEGSAEVTCHFCNHIWKFGREELEREVTRRDQRQ